MALWPSPKQVLVVWATTTGLVCVAYIAYLRNLPPDELVMASDLSFQAMLSVIFVALPSFFLLLLFLLVGSIAKRWIVKRGIH